MTHSSDRSSSLVLSAELVMYPQVGHGIDRNAAAFADAIERVGSFVKALPS